MDWTTDIPDTETNTELLAQMGVVALRRKWLILGVLLATLVGCYVALSFITEQYEAESRLLVKLGRENTEVPLTVDKGGVYTTGVAKEEINSDIQLLTSRALIEATVDRLGVERFKFTRTRPTGFFKLTKYYARQAFGVVKDTWHRGLVLLDLEKKLTDRENAVEALNTAVNAVRERDSNVVIVKIRLPDPKLALDSMSALIDLYLQRHIAVQRDTKLRSVFEGQSSMLAKDLADVQARIAQLKEQSSVSSPAEQRTEMLQRLDVLRRDIDAKTTEQRQIQSEADAVQSRLKELPETTRSEMVVEPSAGRRAIEKRLTDLQLKRVESAGSYADGFQLLKNIDAEIASLKQMLASEEANQNGDVTYQRNPLVAEFQAQTERLRVRQAGLAASLDQERRQVAAVEASLRRLDAADDALRVAELERKVIEDKYLNTQERSSAAQIAEELDVAKVANLVPLAPPSVPAEPVYPPKLLIMGVALGAGLVLGLCLALLLEWASDVIHGAGDVEAIEGLPFLGEFRLARAAEPAAS